MAEVKIIAEKLLRDVDEVTFKVLNVILLLQKFTGKTEITHVVLLMVCPRFALASYIGRKSSTFDLFNLNLTYCRSSQESSRRIMSRDLSEDSEDGVKTKRRKEKTGT